MTRAHRTGRSLGPRSRRISRWRRHDHRARWPLRRLRQSRQGQRDDSEVHECGIDHAEEAIELINEKGGAPAKKPAKKAAAKKAPATKSASKKKRSRREKATSRLSKSAPLRRNQQLRLLRRKLRRRRRPRKHRRSSVLKAQVRFCERRNMAPATEGSTGTQLRGLRDHDCGSSAFAYVHFRQFFPEPPRIHPNGDTRGE